MSRLASPTVPAGSTVFDWIFAPSARDPETLFASAPSADDTFAASGGAALDAAVRLMVESGPEMREVAPGARGGLHPLLIPLASTLAIVLNVYNGNILGIPENLEYMLWHVVPLFASITPDNHVTRHHACW